MSVLDIDSLRALLAVAETGGITRAATKLNLSQSAVSHKMKRLEGRLGRGLFGRADGRLVLNRDGERLLEYARRILKLHDEACASFHQSDLAGELRIGITEDVTAPGMAQILSSFALSFPNVTLNSRVAHSPELIRWLENGEIDMALIEVFESEMRPGDHPLGRQQVAWLVTEDFALDGESRLPFVAYHRDCFYKAWAVQALAAQGRELRVVFECPSIDGMVNAVRSGLGVGLVNLGVFEQLQSGRRGDGRGLRIERLHLPPPPPIQHVARFAGGLPTRQMDKLLELIKQELLPVS